MNIQLSLYTKESTYFLAPLILTSVLVFWSQTDLSGSFHLIVFSANPSPY